MTQKITPLQERDTAFALVLILLICWLVWHSAWFIYLAMCVCVLTMIWSGFMRPLAWIWFGLALALGSVMSKVLLTVVWTLLVLPVGFFRRLMGRDPLKLKKWRSNEGSYFDTRDHTYAADDLKHLY